MVSEAEERIRAKCEAALRQQFPDARIIHELVVQQGSCRLDLAAVTPSRIILVEVKSERDVLTRLPRQVKEARRVSDLFRAVVTDKHLDKSRQVAGWLETVTEDEFIRSIGSSYATKQLLTTPINAPARLAMLWADELRIVAECGLKANRSDCIFKASEFFTGSELRRRICAALRARSYPRADPPILSELFPAVSVAKAA